MGGNLTGERRMIVSETEILWYPSAAVKGQGTGLGGGKATVQEHCGSSPGSTVIIRRIPRETCSYIKLHPSG